MLGVDRIGMDAGYDGQGPCVVIKDLTAAEQQRILEWYEKNPIPSNTLVGAATGIQAVGRNQVRISFAQLTEPATMGALVQAWLTSNGL